MKILNREAIHGNYRLPITAKSIKTYCTNQSYDVSKLRYFKIHHRFSKIFVKIFFARLIKLQAIKRIKSGVMQYQKLKPESVIVYLNVNHIIKERKYYGK